MAVLPQFVLDFVLAVVLKITVERGTHYEETIGHGFRERVDQLSHLVESVVEIIIRRAVVTAINRRRWVAAGAVDLAFGHKAVVDEVVEHHVGARASCRQIDQRREFGRRLEQAGEHRRFRQRHVTHRLAEIVLRGRIDTEGTAAEVGAVEVEFEDFVLAQMRFEPQRQKCFVDLPFVRTLVAQEQILGELLRDR